MGQYKYILFDMDGTLVDSAPGILEAVRYAQEKLHLPVLEDDALRAFLGPPLKVSFQTVYGMEEEAAGKAAQVFREYYSVAGMFHGELYPGVGGTLSILKRRGYSLYIATSKPTIYAKRIAERLGIDRYFTDIVGSNLDNTRGGKQEIIQYIMDGLPAEESESFLMVGDKSHDIAGAAACGIRAIGVSYGFGSLVELENARTVYVIDTIKALADILL